MNKDIKRYTFTCPNCGRKLISAVAANGAEIYCQKCKTMYEIEIKDKQLHVKEIGEEYIANY